MTLRKFATIFLLSVLWFAANAQSGKTEVHGFTTDVRNGNKLSAFIRIYNETTHALIDSVSSDTLRGYSFLLNKGGNYTVVVTPGQDYLITTENFDLRTDTALSEITKNLELSKMQISIDYRLRIIMFETGSAVVPACDSVVINQLVKFLSANPAVNLEISGHCDSREAKGKYGKIDDTRAKAVYDSIVAAGISKERLTCKGYADTRPIASPNTKEGRAMNRRVDFQIWIND